MKIIFPGFRRVWGWVLFRASSPTALMLLFIFTQGLLIMTPDVIDWAGIAATVLTWAAAAVGGGTGLLAAGFGLKAGLGVISKVVSKAFGR